MCAYQDDKALYQDPQGCAKDLRPYRTNVRHGMIKTRSKAKAVPSITAKAAQKMPRKASTMKKEAQASRAKPSIKEKQHKTRKGGDEAAEILQLKGRCSQYTH